MSIVGRFAPSPSGRMHLGNVYCALLSWLSAKADGGQWILRIEDLDLQRCKRQFADVLENDLLWLGLKWDEGGSNCGTKGPYYQSERSSIYEQYFQQLVEAGLTYPCFCRRADLLSAQAPHASDGRVVYSGVCLNLSPNQQAELAKQRPPAIRIRVPNEEVSYVDGHFGYQTENLQLDCGDFIIRRSDKSFAYQLAVVVDDALMGVTQVVRGCDLLPSTHQQLFLYKMLGFNAPQFYHLPLLMSQSGARLAKRDVGADVGALRLSCCRAQRVIGQLAFWAGLIDRPQPISADELLSEFQWNKIPLKNITVNTSF